MSEQTMAPPEWWEDDKAFPGETREPSEQTNRRLFDLTQELSEVGKKKKSLKLELEELGKREEKLMETILLEMDEAGTELVRFKHGSFFPVRNVYASFTDQGAGFEWLKSNGLGDLIKETVNSKTLSAVTRERIENGEAMPECVKVSVVTKVGHRS